MDLDKKLANTAMWQEVTEVASLDFLEANKYALYILRKG